MEEIKEEVKESPLTIMNRMLSSHQIQFVSMPVFFFCNREFAERLKEELVKNAPDFQKFEMKEDTPITLNLGLLISLRIKPEYDLLTLLVKYQ